MKNEEMVCSIEQAKALEKLGVKINTYFVWVESDPIDEANTTEVLVIPRLKKLDACSKGYNYVSFAPNVAELGVLLPIICGTNRLTFELNIKKTNNGWLAWYDTCGYRSTIFEMSEKENEAQSRAEALIWIIENKHTKVEDLKL